MADANEATNEARIRRNIRRMIDQDATEGEIDTYISGEGVDLGNFKHLPDDLGTVTAKGLARGVVGTAGMVLDAPQNLYQLGKAATGVVMGAAGAPAESLPEVTDTNAASNWLKDRIARAANLGSRNEDALSRLVGTGAEIAGAGLSSGTPLTNSGIFSNVLMPAVGGVVGEQIAGEKGKFIGSIAAPLGTTALKAGTARALGAGAAARAQTMKDVSPTLADVSKPGAYVQKAASYVPTGAVVNKIALTHQTKQLDAAVDKLIAVPGTTAEAAGEIVQQGLENWKGRFLGNYRKLKARTETAMPPDTQAQPSNYMEVLRRLTTPDPGATHSTKAIIPKDLEERLANIAADAEGTVTVSALKKIKEEVGSHAFPKFGMISDKNAGQYEALYKALSKDLEDAAKAQDLRLDPTGRTHTAFKAQQVENAFYRTGKERIRQYYNNLSKKADGEKVFKALIADNGEMLRMTMKGLTKAERDIVSSAAIERLGKAKPGQATSADQFSAETFLTQWNVLSDKTKRALFAGASNPSQLADLDSLAQQASLMRDARKILPNPSGSAVGVNIGTTIAAGAAGYFLSPLYWGALATSGAASYLMTNPRFIRWMAQGSKLSKKDIQSHVIRLGNMANSSNDSEFQENVNTYIQSLDQE